VLLFEDDEDTRDVVAMLLEGSGAHVFSGCADAAYNYSPRTVTSRPTDILGAELALMALGHRCTSALPRVSIRGGIDAGQ
jgi:hypothetical protein